MLVGHLLCDHVGFGNTSNRDSSCIKGTQVEVCWVEVAPLSAERGVIYIPGGGNFKKTSEGGDVSANFEERVKAGWEKKRNQVEDRGNSM